MSKVLEVCVDSLASARAAIQGGADRLELCSALAAGGLTPYTELLEQIRRESEIDIRCLMRPRAGDFYYTPEEIEMMAKQIGVLKEKGANGFVIGCLNTDGSLDMDAMKGLVDACGDCGITLHRAMDVSRDLLKTYKDAAALGIDTVLTSGGASSCVGGKETIRELLKLRDETSGPEILIGAGVNAAVIEMFRKEVPACCAFHMSGKMLVESKMVFRREGIPMGLPGLDEWHIQQTDENEIKKARIAIDL